MTTLAEAKKITLDVLRKFHSKLCPHWHGRKLEDNINKISETALYHFKKDVFKLIDEFHKDICLMVHTENLKNGISEELDKNLNTNGLSDFLLLRKEI